MNLASSSEGRLPRRRKNRGVNQGSRTNAAVEAPTKTSVRGVNGAKISASASTVPRSLTKQAARMALPYSVRFSPSSSMTA